MDVEFEDANLDRLETDPRFTAGLPQGVVKAFRLRMQYIRASPDERPLRTMKAWRLEKLKGRADEHSLRLNDQWRLILRFKPGGSGRITVVIRIEDYH